MACDGGVRTVGGRAMLTVLGRATIIFRMLLGGERRYERAEVNARWEVQGLHRRFLKGRNPLGR